MPFMVRTIVYPMLLLLTCLLAIPCQGVSQVTSTPTALSLLVYSDGIIHVTYTLAVAEIVPRVNVTLFGILYENLIVVDENSTFLDYALDAPILTVDSLGAQRISLEWDALDLTNKTSGIWALSIDAPIAFLVTFPKNTTILELSAVPIEITFIDPPLVTMPSGRQFISYIVGTITPMERARETLNTVTVIIANIRASGVNTAPAEAILQTAEAAYAAGKYAEAEALANEALEVAYDIQEAEHSFPTPLLLLGLGSAVAVALGLVLVRRRRGGAVDVEAVLQEYPWLRTDQREVIRFLAEKRAGIFESDLRKAFDLPKSSMWRLIKRLEDEGIVSVRLLRGQNYIELKRKR
jgi:uncharacterized membrane protein